MQIKHNSIAIEALWSPSYYLFPERHNNLRLSPKLWITPAAPKSAEDTLINLLQSRRRWPESGTHSDTDAFTLSFSHGVADAVLVIFLTRGGDVPAAKLCKGERRNRSAALSIGVLEARCGRGQSAPLILVMSGLLSVMVNKAWHSFQFWGGKRILNSFRTQNNILGVVITLNIIDHKHDNMSMWHHFPSSCHVCRDSENPLILYSISCGRHNRRDGSARRLPC